MPDPFNVLDKKISAARADKKRSSSPSESKADDDAGRQGLYAGIEFVASIFIPALIGWKLDEWFGTSPGFFLGLLFLGICGGFYCVYKISQGLGSAVGNSPLSGRKKDGKTASDDKS